MYDIMSSVEQPVATDPYPVQVQERDDAQSLDKVTNEQTDIYSIITVVVGSIIPLMPRRTVSSASSLQIVF